MKLSMTIARVLRSGWDAIRRERAAARAHRDLHALSDHMLRDIGLERGRINSMLTLDRAATQRASNVLLLLASCALVALFLAIWPASAQEVAPDALIKRVTADVLAAVRNDKDIRAGDAAKLDSLVHAKILPHFDFPRATRIAMGINWRRATPEQQLRLVREFRTLLVRIYSGALASYRDQAIEFVPLRARPEDTEVTVRSRVRQPGTEPIVIAYDMEKSGAEWKVFDIRVAGVSLVATYRTSFAEEVRRHGIDGLIALLSRKNGETSGRAAVADLFRAPGG
jgi:phospholipid transport system substrate-binding protein